MEILVISDKDSKTALSLGFTNKLVPMLSSEGHDVITVEASKADILPCTGCLYCLKQSSGDCRVKDMMAEINPKIKKAGLIIYLGPIMFGQYSSTMKNILDKSRLRRINAVPHMIAVGYGDDLSAEEISTFLDIIRIHRGDSELIHPLFKERFEAFVIVKSGDNPNICEEIISLVGKGGRP